MSLNGIFDPMVRAYFAGQCSGGSDGGSGVDKVYLFDLMYKKGEAVEVPEVGTMHYLGKDTPNIGTLFFLLNIGFQEHSMTFYDVLGGEVAAGEGTLILMKDGAILIAIAEGAETTPEEIGFPAYGTYVTEGFLDRPFVLLSYVA